MHTPTNTAGPPRHTRSPHARADGLAAELDSLADIVERLIADFETRLTLPVITATVLRCRRELDIIPEPALPELIERLARQRLHNLEEPAAR